MTDWIPQPAPVSAGATIAAVSFNKHSTGVTHVKERWDRAMVLTGSTDAAVGDLLVLDSSVTDGVALATTAGEAGPILVALEALTHGGPAGQVRAGGFVTCNISGTVARGNLVRVSATGLGEPTLDVTEAFGLATSGATAPGQVSVLMTGGASTGGGGGGGSGGGSGLGQLSPLNAPQTAAFTQINASGLTLTDEADGLYVVSAASAGVHARILAVPYTAPKKLRVALLVWLIGNTAMTVGLAALEGTSTSGKYLAFEYQESSGVAKTAIEAWSLVEAGSVLGSVSVFPYDVRAPVLWMEIEDDNTDFVFRLSADGIHWPAEQFRQGRTVSITPGGYFGIHLQTFSANQVAAIKILHAELV